MQLSIVLPCHNEEQAIPVVLPKLLQAKSQILAETGMTKWEIIVINDGSSDNSQMLLEKYGQEINLINFCRNHGYGYALKAGFSKAQGDFIAFYDLDDTCQPLDLIAMIHELRSQSAGMIGGNRLHTDTHMPPLRYLGNWLYRTLTSYFLGQPIADCCTGMRVFRAEYRDLFCKTLPDQLNFSLAMTILFIRRGGIYREWPINYQTRIGHSKLSVFTDGPRFLGTLLRYCLMTFRET